MTTSSTTLQEDIDADIDAWMAANRARRKPTINDVARLARVSKKTVSRVINRSPLVREETRMQVDAVISRLAYAPDPQARGLAFRHSFLIGMIYDNPNSQYVVNIQEGILEGLHGTEFELAVHRCNRHCAEFLAEARRFVDRQKLFGVILTPSVSEDDRLADIIKDIGCELIRIASVSLDDEQHMIVSNDFQGGVVAAEHLIALGHRHIGFVSGLPGFRSSAERRAGLEHALAAHGLRLDPRHIYEGAYTFGSGVAAGQAIFSDPHRPTAVFAANDQMAVGIVRAASTHGKSIPHDLSVVGFDDFDAAITSTPPLTTIHSPTRDIGRLAATKLIRRTLSDPSAAPLDETTPWLVVRESTAPANGRS